jgi:hypothetical protein
LSQCRGQKVTEGKLNDTFIRFAKSLRSDQASCIKDDNFPLFFSLPFFLSREQPARFDDKEVFAAGVEIIGDLEGSRPSHFENNTELGRQRHLIALPDTSRPPLTADYEAELSGS